MSEYQFLAFRAVDRPLTARELAYARKQSSRAEITRWYFENEYHFGDFGGDEDGLLRHGYDVHLHYANFGIRKIALRLPAGLPFPKLFWSNYIGLEGLTWKKDGRGKGGILSLNPYHESSDLDELWSPGEYLEDVVEVRNRLLIGDARVLYVLWLCAAADQYVSPDIIEPPVPGGLAELVEPCAALMIFFGLDPLILVAASEGAPALPPLEDHQHRCETWVDTLSHDDCRQLLLKLLAEDAAVVKAEMLATVRDSGPKIDWPVDALGRSFDDLLERTEELRAAYEAKEQKKRDALARREAAKQQQDRKNRMKEMAKAPHKWLREVDKLVAARGTQNYQAAGEILVDLRDALGDEGAEITRTHAAHLATKHPTLKHLKSMLRNQGLLE